MSGIAIREMSGEDEYFVSTCSHVNESDEADSCGRRRLAWLRAKHGQGLRVLVALLDDRHAGFAYVVPVEISPWGPIGRDLAVLNCLYVLRPFESRGVGGALVAAALEEARRQQRKALVTIAYHGDFWFMPAGFFASQGFLEVARRENRAIFWKVLDPSAEQPRFLERKWCYDPLSGGVAVDLFWNAFCQTSQIEAERVRRVAAEFGRQVTLREYPAHDPAVLREYQTPRAVLVNGREIGWGYEAPEEGVRAAIREALGGQAR